MIPLSDAESISEDVMDGAVRVVRQLFRHSFCTPVRYSLEQIRIEQRYADGMAKSGTLLWSIDVKPVQADYVQTAYLDLTFDGEIVFPPALFSDHQGQVRGFSDVSVRRFLGISALDDYSPPVLAQG